MLRQAPRLLRLLQQAPGAASEAAPAASAVVSRSYGAPAAGSHDHPTTPLSGIMPTVVSLPRKVVTTAISATGNLLTGAVTSSTVKGLVSSVADRLLVDELVGKVDDLDVPFWASTFSWAGYTNHAGFKKLADAVKPKVASLSPEQVVSLTQAFHTAGYYDKDLFSGLASNISAGFTKYDTEGLVKVVAAFHAFGHYGTQLLDDIADSITYCNHYLAPTKVSPADLAIVLEAYAKAGHERGDLFTTLARGISEVSLGKLAPEARKTAVVTSLRAFYDFQFFPEQIEALLYYAKTEASAFSPEELKDVEKITAAAEDAAGGELKTFTPGGEDADHWYAHHTSNPTSYSLYVFRDSLVPQQYAPSSVRPSK